jgi:hypothetical protein
VARELTLQKSIVPHMRGWHAMMGAKQRYSALQKGEDEKSPEIARDKAAAMAVIATFFQTLSGPFPASGHSLCVYGTHDTLAYSQAEDRAKLHVAHEHEQATPSCVTR